MEGSFSHGPRARPPLFFLSWLLALLVCLAGCSSGKTPNGGGQVGSGTPGTIGNLNIAVQSTTAAVPSPSSVAGPSSRTPVVVQSAGTLPPGATLPSEAQCAARVRRSAFEPRPQNTPANQRVPTAQQIANLTPWGPALGQSIQADTLRKQMTGNFTGTTDEILQWTACKWGVDPDIVRAEAVIESYWRQSTQGDETNNQSLCPPGTWNGQNCYQSYGILQIKYYYFQSTWPMSRDDTAFNAEYVYGILRACYEGWTTYLSERTPLPGYPRYHAGDLWGCIGRWYSGTWYNQDAVNYIARVKATLAQKTWLQAGF